MPVPESHMARLITESLCPGRIIDDGRDCCPMEMRLCNTERQCNKTHLLETGNNDIH